jgi:catechol-2,3-dioxygenase
LKIKEIQVLANNLKLVRNFYNKILQFPVVSENDSLLTFKTGTSLLTFRYSDTVRKPYYHLAFNICETKVQDALEWLKDKGIHINKVDDSEIVHSISWNADSIYFYDPLGNIVEFIARHNQRCF